MATVEDLPKARVTGQFLFVSQDNEDAGTGPNAILVTGYVRFTCSVTPPLVYREKKVHAVPLISDAIFDGQGNLIPLVASNPTNEVDPGKIEPGLELLADSPHVNPQGFTWTVSFALKEAATGRAISIPSYSIYLSDGDDVDLADVMTVGSSGGEYITRGESAYEVAVLEGFKGTRPEWLESLKVKGDKGDSIKGDTGATPQVSIGTVETIANPADGVWVAGLIKGSPDVAAALRESFPTIMKGDKGDTGFGWVPTSLGTEDLNNVLTEGTYRQIDAVNATLERNYPLAASPGAGVLEVLQQGSTKTQAKLQRFTPVWGVPGGRLFYERTYTGGTWSPWRAYASQRVDNTAGRAIYTWDETAQREQLIYGDTGWRDITKLVPEITAGILYYRRTLYQCTIIFQSVLIDVPLGGTVTLSIPHSSATLTGFMPLLSGMTASHQFHLFQYDWAGNHKIIKRVDSGFHSQLSWPTYSAWPTALPGVATPGAIPNL